MTGDQAVKLAFFVSGPEDSGKYLVYGVHGAAAAWLLVIGCTISDTCMMSPFRCNWC